ncbi:MAG TPA: Rrf2 family transcriptional regulator [Gemmatales bacterium]|nr:Rrf2 family transcriptional regulator [Gemmatales bacterium]HMP59996.1 Rrf2 family transcriptional regulator [Gemmatales bacterium]
MKISAQEEYGLRCLLQVARAGSEQARSISEIAEAEGLSAPYVAKLLAVLRQQGYIDSVRGRTGGYRLTRPPEQMPLGRLLADLGEPLFEEPGFCERHAGTETAGCCVHLGDCTLRTLWGTLEGWFRGALDCMTVSDLLRSGINVGELLQQRLAETVAMPFGPADSVSGLIPLRTVAVAEGS